MLYSEIFKDIVYVVHNDYAGWDEKKGWDQHKTYENKIKILEEEGNMTAQDFLELVNDYLADFQEPHMFFHLDGTETKAKTTGFSVRRYEDALFVTNIGKENRLQLGSKIVALDGITVEEFSKRKLGIKQELSYERQDWNSVLNRLSTIGVMEEDGEIITLKVLLYDRDERKPIYSVKPLDHDTLLFTFSDFADVVAIRKLIIESEDKLQTCKKLIIDVRNNRGGNADAFSRLIPYIFPEGEKPRSELPVREFNFTKNNSDLFKTQLLEAIEITESKATRNMLQDTLRLPDDKDVQGFTIIDFSKYITELNNDFKGENKGPTQVIILSDCNCGSAGDGFVSLCKESSKVNVIGRATMGITDYSDLLIRQWENQFYLYYPISRLKTKTKYHPLHGKGVQPNIYIPWTPHHIEEDIDLQRAVELLNELE